MAESICSGSWLDFRRVLQGERGMDRYKKLLTVVVVTGGIWGVGACGLRATALFGQEPNPTAQMAPKDQPQIEKQDNGIYLYRVKVVQRDLDAVNYLHRNGSTNIGFKGTTLMPLAKGQAKVTSERGGIHIEARFQGLTPAQ